jgi:Flp pilus assembly protein TadD
MRWIVSLTLLFALAAGVLAAGTDDLYLDINSQIFEADSLQQGGHLDAAAAKYRNAQSELLKLRADHPGWNEVMMGVRLEYLAGKLKELAQYPAAGTNAPAAAPTKMTPQQQVAALQDQINNLTAANEQLREKIKEALSVQPAAVAPGELTKEQEKNVALEKERDLLAVDLEQQKAAASARPAPAPPSAATDKLTGELAALKAQSAKDAKAAQTQVAELKRQLGDSEKKLADTTADLEKLKSRPPPQNLQELTSERDKLKAQLAAVSKELADREAHPEAPPVKPGEDALKLRQVEQERDNLARQVAALSHPAPNPAAGGDAALSAENAGLRARLAQLEAAAVPYTPEELAVIAAAPAPKPGEIPAPGVTLTRKVHSFKDLPPGVSPLMLEAQRAVSERDYAQAEKKFQEVLAQDEDNIYVLVNLGDTQFAQGGAHLDDCEKTVSRALALDPNDPGALYLLGLLRYTQQKLDEALDALSRSDSINPTNSSTKNYLGCVLSAKGLRTNAETAFRKALELAPLYADAHFNLAFVYATEKPPAPALADWHYKRAVALGHEKSESLEKLIAGGPTR